MVYTGVFSGKYTTILNKQTQRSCYHIESKGHQWRSSKFSYECKLNIHRKGIFFLLPPILPWLENQAGHQNVIFPVQTVLRRPNLITLFAVYTWRMATLLISMKTLVPSEPGRFVFWAPSSVSADWFPPAPASFFSSPMTNNCQAVEGPLPYYCCCCCFVNNPAPLLFCVVMKFVIPIIFNSCLSNSIELQRIRTICWRQRTAAVNINFRQQWRLRLESKCMKFLWYLQTSVIDERQTQREWMAELISALSIHQEQ